MEESEPVYAGGGSNRPARVREFIERRLGGADLRAKLDELTRLSEDFAGGYR